MNKAIFSLLALPLLTFGITSSAEAFGGHRGMNRENAGAEITKTVTNLENGVQIDVTSDDADIVSKIQSREQRTPRRDDVTLTQENISNGVRITITTTDPEKVERLQKRAENGHNKQGKGKGNFGRRGRGSSESRGRFGR